MAPLSRCAWSDSWATNRRNISNESKLSTDSANRRRPWRLLGRPWIRLVCGNMTCPAVAISGSPAPRFPRQGKHAMGRAKRLFVRTALHRRRHDDKSVGYSYLRLCAGRFARWLGGRTIFQRRLDVGPIGVPPLRVRGRDDGRAYDVGRSHDERAHVVGRPYDKRVVDVCRLDVAWRDVQRVQSTAVAEKPQAGWMDSALQVVCSSAPSRDDR